MSHAFGINAKGHVVGQPTFLYRDGTLFDLNQLIPQTAGWNLHTAFGINDKGQIVGFGAGPNSVRGGSSAFLLTPIPSLQIQNSTGSVTLSWPKWSAGYHLMQAAELGGAASAWTQVATSPTDAGEYWQVTLTSGGSGQFFRLQKP